MKDDPRKAGHEPRVTSHESRLHGRQRWNRAPDGWLEPWICEWQLLQLRFTARSSGDAPGGRLERVSRLAGCETLAWHCWHRKGRATTSMLSWLEPWGRWHSRQLRRTGACSQMKGPRFSAWQAVQSAFTLSALMSGRVTEPWGLWQSLQVILPSSSGMCERLRKSVRCCWWQEKQVSLTPSFASSPVAESRAMGLWQSLHARRLESWTEPCQNMRSRPLWHCMHCAFWTSMGAPRRRVKAMIAPLS